METALVARNSWRRKTLRGARVNGRGDVPTCPYPKLGKTPISWHGAGGRRTRGRVPERAGGWSPIATGERQPPCQLRRTAGDAEPLYPELQGGALQPQRHRHAVWPVRPPELDRPDAPVRVTRVALRRVPYCDESDRCYRAVSRTPAVPNYRPLPLPP